MIQNQLDSLTELTILIAEDDPIVRQSLVRTLSLYCDNILEAENGNEAVQLFESRTVNIVILDIDMPGLNGLEVAQTIRKHDADLPILILTCHSDTSYLQKAVQLRLMSYLLKPVSFDKLMDAIKQCLTDMAERGVFETILADGVVFNSITATVTNGELKLQLTNNETRFLKYMLSRRGRLVSITQLCNELGDDYSVNALRNLLYRLRGKIGLETITSIKDLGYILE